MKRMKRLSPIEVALIIVFVVFCIAIAAPASAEERWIEPTAIEYDGGWSYPLLGYNYLPGGEVEVYAWVRSGYQLEELGTAFVFGDGSRASVEEEFSSYVDDDSDMFTPAREVTTLIWEQKVVLGRVSKSGNHFVLLAYDGETDKGAAANGTAAFDLDLPTFDFEESVCILNKRVMVFRLNIFSLEEVPSRADLRIEDEGVEIMDLKGVRIAKYGNFGAIELPVPRTLYRRVFENKKMQVTLVLDGEELVRYIYFPHRANALYTCDRG